VFVFKPGRITLHRRHKPNQSSRPPHSSVPSHMSGYQYTDLIPR